MKDIWLKNNGEENCTYQTKLHISICGIYIYITYTYVYM